MNTDASGNDFANTERHNLTKRLRKSRLLGGMISIREPAGFQPCPAFFVEGQGKTLAIHVVPGTVWYRVTHTASGMSFPVLADYPDVNERTAWMPHALMADAGLLFAVAQLHFLMSTGVDWDKVPAPAVQHHCRGVMADWEQFAFKTLEEMFNRVADEAVTHLSHKSGPVGVA